MMEILKDGFLTLNEMLLDMTGTNLAEVGPVEFLSQNPSFGVFCTVCLFIGYKLGGEFQAKTEKKNIFGEECWSKPLTDKMDAHFDTLRFELEKARNQEEYDLAIATYSNWFSRLVWRLKKG